MESFIFLADIYFYGSPTTDPQAVCNIYCLCAINVKEET